ncbi:hypothetical protein HG443_001495 [Candidatus Saccharibacteria bacterium]|nr:hypothetical protein [Candidatus Saccharibacteria bacterium]
MVEVTYKKKKSFKAIIGVTIFIFVVLLATLITVIVISAQKGDDYKVKKTPAAKQTKKPKPKKEPDDEEETDDKDAPNKPGEQKDPNNTGAKKKKKTLKPIKGKIDNTSLVNGSLQVRVTINEVINDGTCELSLVGPREQKYSNTTQIIANSSTTSICNGFDVLINDVERDRDKQTGKWSVTVNLSTKTRQGKLTGEIIL